MKINVYVSGNMTSCGQLRVKLKDAKYATFVCGIDVDEHHVLTTYGHIWNYSILGLVEDIVRGNRDSYEFRDTERIECLYVDDDSENLELDWDVHRAQLESNTNAFRGLELNDVEQGEQGGWHGVITI